MVVGHDAVCHELLGPNFFIGLEGETAVCTVLSSWHIIPRLVAEGSDFCSPSRAKKRRSSKSERNECICSAADG